VIRFNKDELLGLRKVTKVLEALKDIPDIISIQALEPLTIEAFETEDVSSSTVLLHHYK
jgi:hypothetical protein